MPVNAKLTGIGAAPGVSVGKAVLVRTFDLDSVEALRKTISKEDSEREIKRYKDAVKVALDELESLEKDVKGRLGEDKAAIFTAQRLMLEDPTLEYTIETKISENLFTAERACLEACEEQAKMLESMDDPYFAARAVDMRDIGKRLVRCLLGIQDRGSLKSIPEGSVVVAYDLAPSDTACLEIDKVVGIVLDRGGRTSHTAILARSLGIPAVVGTQNATQLVSQGDILTLDGDKGEVGINPDEAVLSAFTARVQKFIDEKKRLSLLKDLPAMTKDGKRVELAANIGNVSDVPMVLNAGADGVGLFRTEFLFLDRTSVPTEEEQFEAYKEVLSKLSPRPIVVRTLDIGGDKEIPYLGLPKEENPFLGLRAIRLCLKERELFRTQLRALLRAASYGNLKIMFPMISNLNELREAKKEVLKVKEELESQGTKVPDFEVGIMVEIPSAAIDADILARECDFFSIGTNDLVQYTIAVDRGNPEVAYLSDPFHPAVLRLIARTIEEGHKHGIWVGMCGEMAGMPMAAPLLVGMGIDELSMAPGMVLKIKDLLRKLDYETCKGIWDKVREMSTREEIKGYLQSVLEELGFAEAS
ncbi:MAG: phosphoenolpyruvate--protein phosphotransferase [Candidatus Fermentithermobacillus carboniphilus]|uniref:Phosphoenolpyruvate-protein phosphotransferase n=1 Tax=Candidatus Fermentithermobacillus carboniphilus TaxID=3085328 RepID=A0AAT9LAT5_9FIRM|nr:MAG: phosphoenolpyruvate--protein phosphotransferase [Candidatus Fermentithermobacillus carboniphilus]